MSSETMDMTRFGGVLEQGSPHQAFGDAGPNEVWNFGYVMPGARDPVQEAADKLARQMMTPFGISGSWNDDPEMVGLWECAKIANGGKHFLTFWQQTGSCFPAGVPVRMADGNEKPIEAVRLRDRVITHTGKVREVVNLFQRKYTGEMITVTVAGFPFPLRMTACHPVAVMPRVGSRWKPGRLIWKKAGELTQDDRMFLGYHRDKVEANRVIDVADIFGERGVVLDQLMTDGDTPLSRPGAAKLQCSNSQIAWRGRIKLRDTLYENAIFRAIPVTASLARLFGLYLAEGGEDAGRLTFTFNYAETNLAEEVLSLMRGIFGVGGYLEPNEERTTLKVRFDNLNLATVFKHLVPGNVYTKRVPGVFMHAPWSIQRALLTGWLDGDGYKTLKRGRQKPSLRIQGVTSSSGLARDMATLSIACGMHSSSSRRKPRKQSREAFDVYVAGREALQLYPAVAATAQAAGVKLHATDTNRTEFGYARAVRKIVRETVTDLQVFDFEVEEDHSFIAGGMTVHNCVGNGLGQALRYLSAVEVVRLKDPEQVILPFWLIPYGRSRYYGGMRGRGEGSFGSTAAKAIMVDGVVPYNTAGLEQPTMNENDGITWGSSAEMKWSDGGAISEDWLSKSRKHLVKSAANCPNADAAWEAVSNWYPLTIASNWGGQMKPSVQGSPGVLLNKRVTSWAHQMCVIGRYRHPTLGKLFYVLNSWGPRTHGTCPSGAPPGGFWITFAEMDYICRQQEAFILSQFNGFPSQQFRWRV